MWVRQARRTDLITKTCTIRKIVMLFFVSIHSRCILKYMFITLVVFAKI